MKNLIYTIGYTGFTVEELVSRLKQLNINVVIDVRSSPYSERYSDYNKENIEAILSKNGIYYRNYAKEFGARQENRALYSKEGYLDFEKFAKTDAFLAGVEKIKNSVAKGYNIVFLCAEKKPIQCHRTILVARAFYELGYEVIHLVPNNETLSHGEVVSQLLNKYCPNIGQVGLFDENTKSDDEYIAEAYRMQNKKIGYKVEGEEE